MTQLFSNVALERAKKIKLLVLDVDGILSDGRLYFGNNGEEFKTFSTLDGQGMKQLQKSGVKIAIITGRESHIVQKRCKDLGITLLAQGREDKYIALQELLATMNTPPALDEIAHMGDDLPDLHVMTRVGLALTVPNGHIEVKRRSHWQSSLQGGSGAVREACDALLMAQGNYQESINYFLAPGCE